VISDRDREGEAPAEPPSLPARRHPVHGVITTGHNPIIIFLTVCTRNRQPWLTAPGVHDLLREVWTQASVWHVGRYVIMPDHLHLFAAPNANWEGEAPVEPRPEPPSFDAWVRYWKSQFTKRHRVSGHDWQTDHWDRRLRRQESYADKWGYVLRNPVRQGLAARVEDWPYQGELAVLRW
jgi:putative transposase